MKPYTVPLMNRVFRGTFRPIFRLLFHILGGVKITGKENVPRKGAYIITMNHVSLYEAPFLVAFWPKAPEIAGAIEVWSRPGQNLLAKGYHGIPVHRGEYDRQALDGMIAALQSGRPLLLAPEGGRSHDTGMRRAMPGVAYVADKTGSLVIPVGIVGTTEDFLHQALRLKRPILEMRIGQPINLPQVAVKGADRREALQAHADHIMQAIAALLPQEYRGFYHEEQNG